jgi:hypothetical protein
MSRLFNYARSLVEKSRKSFVSGEVFAKVLTRTDDSGRHGVLIPSDAYSYFPNLPIPDPTQNTTGEFSAFDTVSVKLATVAYKYYERYPERRITRLPGVLNDVTSAPRLLVFLRAKHADGTTGYYFDCANSAPGGRFGELFELIFGNEISPAPGNFVVRPVDSEAFSADQALTELLGMFDEVKERGWIDSLREGDTGIGYTFETLLGIKENNDQKADFKGIEIKCKGMKEGSAGNSSKINLFQAGPTWNVKVTSKELIRILGRQGDDGLFTCYSQVTATPNNLGLLLDVLSQQSKIDLRKNLDALGYWSFRQLENRLAEKHSRTVFVKARNRSTKSKSQYSYEELVYCDKPSIERFVDLVEKRNIVFEFTMSEKSNGTVRNHGYPWRLIRAEFLDQLFAFQIKLR